MLERRKMRERETEEFCYMSGFLVLLVCECENSQEQE